MFSTSSSFYDYLLCTLGNRCTLNIKLKCILYLHVAENVKRMNYCLNGLNLFHVFTRPNRINMSITPFTNGSR